MPRKASEKQIGGNHYKCFKIQPSEYCYSNGLNTLASNIVKYATRAGKKGDREDMRKDLDKIIHYAELWLEYEGFEPTIDVREEARPVATPPMAVITTEYHKDGWNFIDEHTPAFDWNRYKCRDCGHWYPECKCDHDTTLYPRP